MECHGPEPTMQRTIKQFLKCNFYLFDSTATQLVNFSRISRKNRIVFEFATRLEFFFVKIYKISNYTVEWGETVYFQLVTR